MSTGYAITPPCARNGPAPRKIVVRHISMLKYMPARAALSHAWAFVAIFSAIFGTGSCTGDATIAALQAEVRALTTLVLSQNERLTALETNMNKGSAVLTSANALPSGLTAQTSENVPPASAARSRRKQPPPPNVKRPLPPPPPPPPPKPPKGKEGAGRNAGGWLRKPDRGRRKKDRGEPARAAITRPTMLSPDLRMVAEVRLGAGLAVAAVAPAATGTSPRFIVAADTLGRLHIFDAVGRALMPPSPLVPETDRKVRVLAMVFLGASGQASGQASGRAAAPMLLAAAIAYGDDDAGEQEGFLFCLYRILPAPHPTPQQRVVVDLMRESNVTWPLLPAADLEGKDTKENEAQESSTSRRRALTGAGSDPAPPRLVALETMVSSGPSAGGKAASAAPTFLAVRSDGMLVTLSSVGGVLAGVTTGISGVRMIRRSGTALALLSHERLVLLELARRAPPRDCAIPESLIASGGRLTSVAFDAHVPQLVYAATSSGSTLIFNSRARAPPPPTTLEGDAGVSEQKKSAASTIECRWLDDLAFEPGFESEASDALSTVKGYLVAVGEQTLSARNVSTLYHASAEPSAAALVHFEPVSRSEYVEQDERPPRVLLGSGSVLVVESDDLSEEDGSGQQRMSRLRIYSSTLPYEPPVPPTWPKYVMGIAVVGITGIYQLYKRRGKGKNDDNRADRYGPGGDRYGPGGDRGKREDPFAARYGGRGGRPGQTGSWAQGAEAHYAAHMGAAYGQRGGTLEDDESD